MTPHEVKKMRFDLGLSASEAAELVCLAHPSAWQRYEQEGENGRSIPAPTERLFLWMTAGLPQMLAALYVATHAHQGQFRLGPGKVPYIVHPIDVAGILLVDGLVTDADVLTAGILHDVLEDSDVTKAALTKQFGRRVSDLVAEVTFQTTLHGKARRAAMLAHAPKLSPDACAIKLADMIANCADTRTLRPEKWSDQRVLDYCAWMIDMANAMRFSWKRLSDRLRSEVDATRRHIQE